MPRPAKSAELHELQGTVSEAKPPTHSTLKPGRAKIPKHLSQAARSEFKRCNKVLLDRGHATPGDYATLSVYAEVFSRWIAAKAEIEVDGLRPLTPVTDSNGQVVMVKRNHPLLPVVSALEGRLLALAKSLGLTVVDRDKPKQTAQKPTAPPLDEAEDFFDNGPRILRMPRPDESTEGEEE
jgi:P27 family predicted phage terminase small subunit